MEIKLKLSQEDTNASEDDEEDYFDADSNVEEDKSWMKGFPVQKLYCI
jgi:hypothetical protein